MLKKVLSVFLCFALLTAVFAVPAGAVTYQPVDCYTVSWDTPTCEEAIDACGGNSWNDVQYIYFQLPQENPDDSSTVWTNHFNSTDLGLDYCQVCLYWWNGIGSVWPDGTKVQWVGYRTTLVDAANRIYRAAVPNDGDTPMVVWNNGVNGGMDETEEIFNYARQIADANIEGAEEGDYDTLPEGSPNPDNMDGCIQIIDYDHYWVSPLTYFKNYYSDWYVYYGDGCYGYYPTTSEYFYGKEENCVNPEHFDEYGNHVGVHSSCKHQNTESFKENYRSYGWGSVYDLVTVCTDCWQELSRSAKKTYYHLEGDQCYDHGNTLYSEDENYQYFSWGYSYDTVTYCWNCGDEISRKCRAVLSPEGDDPPTPPEGSGIIYFDAASAGWEDASYILFYIQEIDGEELGAWGSKKKLGGTKLDNNIWAFDAGALGVVPGKQYRLIMYNFDTSAQCYDLLLDTTCFGDTVYADPNVRLENPVDSNKSSMIARWKNNSYGPIKQITSIGNVIGETIPANTSAYRMMVNFLASKGVPSVTNALYFNGKDVQSTIDYVASELGLSRYDVMMALDEAATTGDTYGDRTDWRGQWDASRSSLPSDGTVTATGYASFFRYLVEDLPRLRNTDIRTDQYLVDDEARERGLKKADVKYVMEKYDLSDIEWSESKCKLDSGYSYVDGGYYLYSTDSGSEYGYGNIPGYYLFNYDTETDHYLLDLYSVDARTLDSTNAVHHVAVAQYQNGRFTKVSGDLISASPRLYFFRPGENSNFGYNTAGEIPGYGNVSYATSSSSSASTSSYPYAKPEVTSITTVSNGLKITWKANGAAKYRVFVKEGTWKTLGDTTDTSYTFTNVKSGNAYNFTVRCVSADGKSWTSDFEAAGWSGRYLDVPAVTSLQSAKEGVKIKWNPVAGNAKYRVFVKYLDTWKSLGDTYDTEFIHSSKGEGSIYAHAGQTYTYTVRCLSYNSKAFTSAYNDTGWTIEYAPPTIYSGDVDGNGEVDIADATFVFRSLAGISTPCSEDDLIAGDVNENGYLEVMDITAIQYYLSGLYTPFRIGKRIN